MKVVKLNAIGEFNRYMCTLLYSFFFLSVQVMLCLHVSCKARIERACIYSISQWDTTKRERERVSHGIILGTICGVRGLVGVPHSLAMFYHKLCCLASL